MFFWRMLHFLQLSKRDLFLLVRVFIHSLPYLFEQTQKLRSSTFRFPDTVTVIESRIIESATNYCNQILPLYLNHHTKSPVNAFIQSLFSLFSEMPDLRNSLTHLQTQNIALLGFIISEIQKKKYSRSRLMWSLWARSKVITLTKWWQ